MPPLWPLDLAEGTKIAVLLVEPIAAKLEVIREAMNDPLFLADLEELAEDSIRGNRRSINLIYPVLDSDGGQQVAEVSDIASDNNVTACQSHRGGDHIGVSFPCAVLLTQLNELFD